MNRFVFLFCLLFLVRDVVIAEVSHFAPLNPEYVDFIKKNKSQKNLRSLSDGNFLGYKPSPNKFSTNLPANRRVKARGLLPSRFDLRNHNNKNFVSKVKHQGECGSCWTFATLASLESSLMLKGSNEFDLSENSMKECHEFVWTSCNGGNSSIATAYLTKFDGPKSEVSNPYSDSDGACSSSGDPLFYVSDYQRLPADVDIIKQTLMSHGAIYTSMFWSNDSYRIFDQTYYYNGSEKYSNHAVTLVGWDDNKKTAGGTGAWIIKNSWGQEWGELGFFYISYDDKFILKSENAIWPKVMDYKPYAKLYMHDKLGAVLGYGWNESTGFALIKFVAENDLVIEKIGTWIQNSGTKIDIEIYDNFDGKNLSNRLGTLKNQNCTYSGYYTFNLTSSINVNQGNDFYIKVIYKGPAESSFNIPIETTIDGYSNPTIETGKCWVKFNNINSWEPVGSRIEWKEFDLCIRAYTTEPEGSRPEINTNEVTGITDSTAIAKGEITLLGDSEITEHGVCWSTTADPTIFDNKSTEGPADSIGIFTSNLTELYFDTTYHYRAYATNSRGTIYGTNKIFKTLPLQKIIKPLVKKPLNASTISSGIVVLAIEDYSGLGIHSRTLWRIWRWDKPAPVSDECNTCEVISSTYKKLTEYRAYNLKNGLKYGWQCGIKIIGLSDLIWTDVNTFIKGSLQKNSDYTLKNGTINMTSFPLWPENDISTAAFSLENNDWEMFTYNLSGSDYSGHNDGLIIEPGKSYFMYRLENSSLVMPINGVSVSTTEDLEVKLLYNSETNSGWNMIAPPNNKTYSWGDVEIVDYDKNGKIKFGPTPINELDDSNPYIELSLWSWNGRNYESGKTALLPYKGYSVTVKQDGVSLIFPQRVQKEDLSDVEKVVTNEAPTEPPPHPDFPVFKSGDSESKSGCFINGLIGYDK